MSIFSITFKEVKHLSYDQKQHYVCVKLLQASQTNIVDVIKWAGVTVSIWYLLAVWENTTNVISFGAYFWTQLQRQPPDMLGCYLQAWASCCRFPQTAFPESLVSHMCVCSFYFKNKDNWVCVITPFPKMTSSNYIKMQKTAQNKLGFLPCWVGPSYRTLCWVNITLSVVEFVCSKQQTTREDVSVAVA